MDAHQAQRSESTPSTLLGEQMQVNDSAPVKSATSGPTSPHRHVARDEEKSEKAPADVETADSRAGASTDKTIQTWRQAIVMIGLLLASLIMSLDGTMVVTAIPQITKEFSSIQDIGWYGSAYYMGLVLAQPVLASLYFQLNEKYVFWWTLLVFEIGSIVAATARHSYVLIIGRALGGAGASGLFSGSLIIANYIASDKQKPVFVGLISSLFGLGSAAGPLIGGGFTDSSVTWRFIFWLSLPIGAACVVATLFYQPDHRWERLSLFHALRKLDIVGISLLTVSLLCLLLALQWGIAYGWSSSREIGLLVGFAAALVLFLGQQRFIPHNDNQILTLRILKVRTVAACAVCDIFFTMALQVQIYYLPIYFQVVKSSSPLLSGVEMIPYLGAMVVSPIISGILTAKFRLYQPFLWFGLAAFIVGSGLLYTITTATTLAFVIGAQIVIGFGTGMVTQTIISAVQSSVAPQDVPLGTSLHVFCISLGPTIAVAAAQDLFIRQLAHRLANFGIDPGPFITGGAVAVPQVLRDTATANGRLIVDSYSYALSKTFLFTLVCACAAFAVSLTVSWKRIAKQ